MAPQAAPTTPVAPTPAGFEIYDPATDPKATPKAAVTPPVVEATPAAPKHPAKLASQARLLGLSDADAAKLSAADLTEWVSEAAISRLVNRPDVAPAVPATTVPAVGAEPVTPAVVKPDLLVKLKETVDSDIADALHAYIDARLADQGPRLDKLEAAMSQALGFVKQKRDEEADSQIDQGFADLGPGYEKLFGKGNGSAMDKNDARYKRRVQLVGLLRGRKLEGTVAQAVVEMGQKLYGDLAGEAPKPGKTPKPPTKVTKLEKDPENGQFTGRRFTEQDFEDAALVVPTHQKNGEMPLGVERAKATIKAHLEGQGAEAGLDINQGQDAFLG